MDGLQVSDDKIREVGRVLCDVGKPLKQRFRALFTLKNLGGPAAIDCIAAAFGDDSALLKHELAYCLGQMRDPRAVPVLVAVLEDCKQEPIVRHESGEALAAIGHPEVLSVLEKYKDDPIREIAETCELAIQRINGLTDANQDDGGDRAVACPYGSVDPAPPAPSDNVSELQAVLLDDSQQLFERYRAMFALRNTGSPEAVHALAEGLFCGGALFRHEVAFVLGQLQKDASVPQLVRCLRDASQHEMVRHECAEALGAMATDECYAVLRECLLDERRVVRESCEVALDMCDYEKSDVFQYADTLATVL